jgi:hypothetical protein
VQVPDDEAALGDRLALELEDEPEHAVGGRVLRTHVHHDPLVVQRVGTTDDRIPVAAGDGEDLALARFSLGGVGHYWYDLLRSGGGISAPLYSTGTPPSG